MLLIGFYIICSKKLLFGWTCEESLRVIGNFLSFSKNRLSPIIFVFSFAYINSIIHGPVLGQPFSNSYQHLSSSPFFIISHTHTLAIVTVCEQKHLLWNFFMLLMLASTRSSSSTI
ncbi:hypothetical protein L1887_19631 [Cichorium endivia]|nr:hypothetical protein L1887_19631 [Cichorium endivia]